MSEANGGVTKVKPPGTNRRRDLWVAVALSLFALVAFYLSTKAMQQDLDYTFRIASALLHGRLDLGEKPPSWLNEMVLQDGKYYSVFPLGAVLSMGPVSLLEQAGWIHNFPGDVLGALIAGLSTFFFFRLSSIENSSLGRRILLALFPVFGTWTWCNLGFGGAWQIALGLALIGEIGALYFILVRPSFVVAGTFFALAFGNRTELILTLPVYLYLCIQSASRSGIGAGGGWNLPARQNWRRLIGFLVIPTLLALLTAGYNYARFHSIFDFGYTHIANLLEEPWYQHGLFSVHAIPGNIYKMLFEGMDEIPEFPYLRPHGFGCSIFIASPFLFLLFRQGGDYKLVSWTAIALSTFALWCHGNTGGWQFSYRYGMILLPWMYLLLMGNGPKKLSGIEISLFVVSVAINALAVYEFLWTDQIQP